MSTKTRRLLGAALLLACLARGGRADPSSELGSRLSLQATEFLASLLGPGRGRALVNIEAERRETHTQHELSTPVEALAPAPAPKSLPGYSESAPPPRKNDTVVTSRENQQTSSDLVIKRIRVTAVLDTRLTPAQVESVRRLLPEFLQMDGDRGDDIAIVRATLRPAWKDALEGPEGVRALLVVGAILLVALFLILTAYLASVRAVNALSAELAARRPPAATQTTLQWGAAPALTEGELLPGGIPGLGSDGSGQGGMPALGRRFDFLAGRKPDELGRMLEPEPAEDLAALFAYLANTNPDLASSAFSSLSTTQQSAVSQALLGLKMADPERLAGIEGRLKTAAEFGLRGAERLGRILSRLPPDQREGLLGELGSSSPDAVADVERSLFPFEELATLKPVDMRRLLTAIPFEEWGVALRGASRELADAVLNELQAGPRDLVRATMEAAAPRQRVQEARSRILSQLQTMAERGQITIDRGAELI